ncbi:MAG: ribonuclease R [Phenylobacterium sp.]|jgi:ribonuclease R
MLFCMSINDPFYQREKEKYENPVPSREFILAHLTELAVPASFQEMLDSFKLVEDDLCIGLKRRLRAMERDGQIIFTRAKRYALPDKMELIQGSVMGHRDGFGFLNIGDQGDDWYIPAHQMKSLMHGDRILAKSHKKGFKNKPEASLVRVLKSRSEPIVGRYCIEGGMGMVVPEDVRIGQDILIQPGEENGARLNQMVAVEVTQRPSHRMNAMGRITEVLGEHMAPGMEIEIALRNHDIPYLWPKEVTEQVADLSDSVPEEAKQGRVDLTHLPLVTIDGEDARDFDDAVYCETKKSGGWRLWVAIADVSSYVTKGSPLDLEALNRGNSVYFPENVIPMLPEILSNGLCSLNPKVDRLTLVCEMTVSAKGKLSGFKFYEAVMNSACRFTYTQVAAILDGDKALCQQHQALVPHLEALHQLYGALQGARRERGAIEFETVETRFVFNKQRKIDCIVPVVRNDAHKLIEECMILANVSAARFIEKHEAHALFRVHEQPDQAKLGNFRRFLGELGIETTLSLEPKPKELTAELARLADRDDHELISIMLLRSMKQAVYQAENNGHFGLALTAYAHYTSPIRRYPDLVVHRTIKGILKSQQAPTHGAYLYEEDEAAAIGLQCSTTERRADDATREVSDWLKCEYMQDHVGGTFDGIIASVTNFGFFVRLSDLFIDGLVHVTSLRNDYYHFDAARHCLIGESSRKVYRMGDPVTVDVAAVNLEQRKIDFTIAVAVDLVDKEQTHGKKGAEKSLSVREQLAKGMIGKEQRAVGDKPGRRPKPGLKHASAEGSKDQGHEQRAKSKPKTGSKANSSPKKKPKTVNKKTRPGRHARKKAKAASSDK